MRNLEKISKTNMLIVGHCLLSLITENEINIMWERCGIEHVDRMIVIFSMWQEKNRRILYSLYFFLNKKFSKNTILEEKQLMKTSFNVEKKRKRGRKGKKKRNVFPFLWLSLNWQFLAFSVIFELFTLSCIAHHGIISLE